MSESVEAVATYDGTAEALWCAWDKPPEASDGGFWAALAGFEEGLAKGNAARLIEDFRLVREDAQLEDSHREGERGGTARYLRYRNAQSHRLCGHEAHSAGRAPQESA